MPLRLDRSSADFNKLFATFLAAKREASADVVVPPGPVTVPAAPRVAVPVWGL